MSFRPLSLPSSLALVLLVMPSASKAQTADVLPYVEAGASNKRGDACFADVRTNAAVHLLSGFLEIWQPRSPHVDAGTEAPARETCPAVARTDWDGIPNSDTDGRVLARAVHDANIAYVVKATRGRTGVQTLAAYLDDRREKNASIVDGLGPLTAAWKAGTHQTTTITAIAPDAASAKAEDKGNGRGIGSKPDAKAGTPGNPDLGLAVDLLNAASVDGSTEPAKRYFKYARPYRWSPAVAVPEVLEPAKSDKPVEDGGFPSGHTAEGWRDALTIAYLVPQRFQELVTRAAEMGENRIRAGMHSPLDVMGGRMLATAEVVYNLNKPENAALRRDAFLQTQAWLARQAGAERLGDLLRVAHSADADTDRFADAMRNRRYVAHRLTYGLPSLHPTDRPATVPKGAEILLETRFPYLDPAQRREVLRTTAIASGAPLLDDAEGYGRLDLFAAADGYGALDADVTVTMEEASGGFNALDTWRNDLAGRGRLVKRGDGALVLAGINTYAGGTLVEKGAIIADSPSALGLGPVSVGQAALHVTSRDRLLLDGGLSLSAGSTLGLSLGQGTAGRIQAKAPVTLAGRLRVDLADGFQPAAGTAIELVKAPSLAGTFSGVDIEGHHARLDYRADAVILTLDD